MVLIWGLICDGMRGATHWFLQKCQPPGSRWAKAQRNPQKLNNTFMCLFLQNETIVPCPVKETPDPVLVPFQHICITSSHHLQSTLADNGIIFIFLNLFMYSSKQTIPITRLQTLYKVRVHKYIGLYYIVPHIFRSKNTLNCE